MTNLTAWNAATFNSASMAYFAAFNAADLNSLANLSCVLSTVANFDNTGGSGQFMDISFVGAIASSTIASGAGMAFWLWPLQGDGTTLGDGRLTAGTQVASTTYGPLMNPLGGYPIAPGTTITTVSGSVHGLTLPPRAFRLVVQNQSGFALAASGNSCWISVYRQNTNA